MRAGPMRILGVSDIPALLRDNDIDTSVAPEVDLIVSCGDLPYDYLVSLAKAFHAPLYYVKGNHDIRPLPKECSISDGCMEIDRRVVAFEGITLLGISGCQWYNGGENQYTEAQMKRIFRGIKRDLRKRSVIDIVGTHAPPRKIHDKEDTCHRGFKTYRALIEKYKPRYFLHGHIHQLFSEPSQRVSIHHGTKVINCCGYHYLEIAADELVR
jgi:uncharacterized protein